MTAHISLNAKIPETSTDHFDIFFNHCTTSVVGASCTREAETIAQLVLANVQMAPEQKGWLETALRNQRVKSVSREEYEVSKAKARDEVASFMSKITKAAEKIKPEYGQEAKREGSSTK
jgi:hypothetical protein